MITDDNFERYDISCDQNQKENYPLIIANNMNIEYYGGLIFLTFNHS